MSTLRKILVEKDINCKSMWFMRQAGRYLPEFRKIRSQNKNFINLCLNSKLSSQITLQPIKRYNLDSAIVFSDILLVPHALGQEVKFIENQGPVLSEFNIDVFKTKNESIFTKELDPVYQTIQITREKLNKNKSLISFIGSPWTLLVYMFNLKNKKHEINLNKFYSNKLIIKNTLKQLIKYLCSHIEKQVNSGSDVVQIFDSWAGVLPKDELEQFCYIPNLEIVNYCKKRKIPTICFPKGIGTSYLDFNNFVNPDGINLDYDIDPLWAKENLKNVVFQGGMNPKILLKNESEVYAEAKKYLDIFKEVPYIFNFGHGLIPETDPDKLGNLINFVKNYK